MESGSDCSGESWELVEDNDVVEWNGSIGLQSETSDYVDESIDYTSDDNSNSTDDDEETDKDVEETNRKLDESHMEKTVMRSSCNDFLPCSKSSGASFYASKNRHVLKDGRAPNEQIVAKYKARDPETAFTFLCLQETYVSRFTGLIPFTGFDVLETNSNAGWTPFTVLDALERNSNSGLIPFTVFDALETNCNAGWTRSTVLDALERNSNSGWTPFTVFDALETNCNAGCTPFTVFDALETNYNAGWTRSTIFDALETNCNAGWTPFTVLDALETNCNAGWVPFTVFDAPETNCNAGWTPFTVLDAVETNCNAGWVPFTVLDAPETNCNAGWVPFSSREINFGMDSKAELIPLLDAGENVSTAFEQPEATVAPNLEMVIFQPKCPVAQRIYAWMYPDIPFSLETSLGIDRVLTFFSPRTSINTLPTCAGYTSFTCFRVQETCFGKNNGYKALIVHGDALVLMSTKVLDQPSLCIVPARASRLGASSQASLYPAVFTHRPSFQSCIVPALEGRPSLCIVPAHACIAAGKASYQLLSRLLVSVFWLVKMWKMICNKISKLDPIIHFIFLALVCWTATSMISLAEHNFSSIHDAELTSLLVRVHVLEQENAELAIELDIAITSRKDVEKQSVIQVTKLNMMKLSHIALTQENVDQNTHLQLTENALIGAQEQNVEQGMALDQMTASINALEHAYIKEVARVDVLEGENAIHAFELDMALKSNSALEQDVAKLNLELDEMKQSNQALKYDISNQAVEIDLMRNLRRANLLHADINILFSTDRRRERELQNLRTTIMRAERSMVLYLEAPVVWHVLGFRLNSTVHQVGEDVQRIRQRMEDEALIEIQENREAINQEREKRGWY